MNFDSHMNSLDGTDNGFQELKNLLVSFLKNELKDS
jgi:hypothetical protein